MLGCARPRQCRSFVPYTTAIVALAMVVAVLLILVIVVMLALGTIALVPLVAT